MGKDQDSASTNTSCFLQVLGVGSDTGCTVPSALLFFDRHRYLFNAGEGFQRFCVEHKVKLTKITSVLATRVTTEATGGLPGMLLTMADSTAGGLLTGHVGMTVHGPPGLHTLVNAFRTFVNVRDMGLKVAEFGKNTIATTDEQPPPLLRPVVKNEAVTITPIIIRPDASVVLTTNGKGDEPAAKRHKANDNADTTTTNNNGTSHAVAAAATDAAQAQTQGMDMPSTPIESAAACYVCELPDIPGKFLPQKAASLGVPRGPLYGRLVKGEEVVAANGKPVKPEDVMEPSTPGPVVLVVDCPSEAFIPQLVMGGGSGGGGLGGWAAQHPDTKKKGMLSCE